MAALTSLLLSSLAIAAAWNIGQEVPTSSGIIKGHASSWQGEVSEYLGVPFAQPPVGPLSFSAPQPYKGSGVFDASKFVSYVAKRCRVSI
jgi:carboxylesterase type B